MGRYPQTDIYRLTDTSKNLIPADCSEHETHGLAGAAQAHWIDKA
jgi:hypothetical protein